MTADDEEEPAEGRFPQEAGHVDTDRFGEPEEPDPDDIGPPIPEVPDPTPEDVDVDPALTRLFWGLVLVFNAALLATSLGAMIVVFEGKPALGGQLVLVGLVLFGYGLYRYRKNHPAKSDDASSDDADDETDDEAGADTN